MMRFPKLRDLPIRQKLHLVILATTGSALLLAGAALLLQELLTFRRNLHEELENLSQLIGHNAVPALVFDDASTATVILSALRFDPQIQTATLYLPDGTRFASFSRAEGEEAAAVPRPDEYGIMFQRERVSFFTEVMEGNEEVGEIHLIANYSRVRDRMVSYAGIVFFALAVSLGGAYLISTRAQRVVSEPILDLARTAQRVSQEHDYSVRARKSGEDELGVFVDAFNNMLSRIHAQDQELRRSHEQLEQRVRERTRELQQLQRRNELILNSAGEGIYGLALNGTAAFVNPAVGHMTGWDPAELRGRTEAEILGGEAVASIPDDSAANDPSGPAQSAGSASMAPASAPVVAEITVRRKDGSRFPASYHRAPIVEADRVVGTVVVLRDITERKNAEESLKRQAAELARSNADLEQFAYVASHDLQEPLRMVSNYTQLLARRYRDQLDADAQEFIRYAVDGATRMQGLIQDLLHYSRVGTRGKEFRPTDCEGVVDLVTNDLRRAIEESGATITHDPLPTISGDSSQLTQLFLNLLANAIKFRGDEPPRIHVGVEAKETEWEFSVEDNGIGIDPDYAERIFVIFQRLHGFSEYPGTGIGLAICKKIVERHGGRIWVRPNSDKGAKFCFTIPFEPEQHTAHVSREQSG